MLFRSLQWSEFVLAERLQAALTKSAGYTVWIPLSREEKGVDLAILKRTKDCVSQTATIQVKASRTYRTDEPKRPDTQRHAFHTWFNRFHVSDDADFFLLYGQYAPDVARTRKVGATWYRDMTLLFTNAEMRDFMQNCKTVGGNDDPMFGFGFDDDSKIVQIRGDSAREQKDFTDRLLGKRIQLLKDALGA